MGLRNHTLQGIFVNIFLFRLLSHRFFCLFFFSFLLKQPQNQTSENLFVGCKFLVSSNLAAAPLDSNNSFWQCFPIAINM